MNWKFWGRGYNPFRHPQNIQDLQDTEEFGRNLRLIEYVANNETED